MNIFEKRTAYEPVEYAWVLDFVDAVNESFWTFKEWTFQADVQDFHTKLSPVEQSAIKNTLLAISQIEVSVKLFWPSIGTRFPKSEFQQAGITMGESEVRHARLYSRFLKVAGFNREFDQILQEKAIKGRVTYLTKYLKGAAENSNERFTMNLTLFTLLIENVSLFTQFAIIKSFFKARGLLKDIDNGVKATMREEEIHARFGAQIINTIKAENPDWFTQDFYTKVVEACHKAYEAECEIIDWIFKAGELDFLSKDTLREFTKERINQSLAMIGGPQIFEINEALISPLRWFHEELKTTTSIDFFSQKSTAYSKSTQAFDEDSIFS